MLHRPILIVLLLSSPDIIAAESQPDRTRTVIVYGDEACPQAVGDEIVVCARQPETERYRIPKPLRDAKSARPTEVSWASRVQGLEEASRPGMPGSCSVVGTGGQSGCREQMLRQWYAERQSR